jgi:thiamine kinase-like enzyme
MSAYRVGIASKPIFINDSYMIYRFLEGIHKQKLTRSDVRDLAKLLNTLHDIEIKKRYKDRDLVLTHHDLNPKNILFSKSIKLIDWEFARVDDRYFDLSSICVEFALSRASEYYFLKCYFKKDNMIDLGKLKRFKKSYIKLCRDWTMEHNTP